MTASFVTLERKGRIAVVRFDLSDGKNALSQQIGARKASTSRAPRSITA
jgi:hypothetical protein